jgi:hypothetical protein
MIYLYLFYLGRIHTRGSGKGIYFVIFIWENLVIIMWDLLENFG